ncbi:MAG: GNAT family N-acetyltransferase [Aggregatilineales bacterium]
MIYFTDDLTNITEKHLTNPFFIGWMNPPSPQTHLQILHGSYKVWLAIDDESGQIVGFISAISDGVLAAFIPNLEVSPDYQEQGIGSELVKRMLDSLNHLYSIDLICDDDVVAFYERLGLRRAGGMLTRNYDKQSGSSAE